MLNIGRGWLVSVTMLNIRRERRREHPMDTSEGVTWPSVTTSVAQLPKRNPKGSNDLRSHPVAMLLLLRKKRGGKAGHAQNILPVRATSGQKAQLGRIVCNFRLRMRRTYFRTCDSRHFRSRDSRHFRSRHVRSRHFRSCAMFRSSARSSANDNWAVPIYYSHTCVEFIAVVSNLSNI
jgi:hypothetical protein